MAACVGSDVASPLLCVCADGSGRDCPVEFEPGVTGSWQNGHTVAWASIRSAHVGHSICSAVDSSSSHSPQNLHFFATARISSPQ